MSQQRWLMYRFCWLVMFTLDWIPGYCRYYTVREPANPPPGWYPRFGDFQRHWTWQWHALWGFRLLSRLGLVDMFADECDRRAQRRNCSSGS